MHKYLILLFAVLFVAPLQAQTKKLKRPKGTVGISSVDGFVRESFDLYNKVYMYDGYAAAGKSLEDQDIDVLEDALEDMSILSTTAPDIISSLDGVGALKQGRALLRINRAKKALKYSIKTSKKLLLGSPQEQEPSEDDTATSDESTGSPSGNSGASGSTNSGTEETATPTFKINSKFDFVPGHQRIFFDDYSLDFIGDFPSKWNTNGSGEVVTINNDPQRWLEIIPGHGVYYIPNIDGLPEEYTIEFDAFAIGLDRQTASTAKLQVELADNTNFTNGKYYASVWLPFGQYAPFDINIGSYHNGGPGGIRSNIRADIRDAVKNIPHISIAVNKERFRLWVNDKKYVDIPKLVAVGKLNTLRFQANNFKDGKEKIFISNVKIAKGGLDLRRTLMTTGKVSTSGILFHSGSDVIQPQSYGILKQISQVLQQDTTMKLRIIGHTDSDGGDVENLTLSRKRATAVKTAIEKTYGISSNRLTTDGKGASQPVAENSTPNGKAQNRRVEFIKQ